MTNALIAIKEVIGLMSADQAGEDQGAEVNLMEGEDIQGHALRDQDIIGHAVEVILDQEGGESEIKVVIAI
jgi:hypothetical protein